MIRRVVAGAVAALVLAAVPLPYRPATAAAAAVNPVATEPQAAQHEHHHGSAATAVSATTLVVEMVDNAFVPAAVTVATGTTVTWTNHGSRMHTVTASSPAGVFESGYIAVGASWSFVFATAGVYVYHCDIHTGMAGTVTVVGASATPAPSAGPAVSVEDSRFTPASLVVPVGATVVWTNHGAGEHTVSATGLFASGRIAPGGTFSFTFATAGAFGYVCDIHAGMAGTLIVGTAPTAPPAPVPTPTPSVTPPPAATTPPPSSTTPPSTQPSASAAPAGGGASVDLTDDTFTPHTLTVPAGTTVTWTNHGSHKHTVTQSGSFDSGLLATGQTFSHLFATPGTYDYVCDIHSPGMAGSIVVTGTAGATPTPSATVGPTATPTPTPAPTAAPAGSVTVTVADNSFSPATVTVTPGTTVVWTNQGARSHTVTGVGPGSGTLRPGGSYAYRFDAVGSFSYSCDFHSEMTGRVVVAVAGGPTPTAAPTVAPSPTPTAAPLPAGATSVTVTDNAFTPPTLAIATGATVTWVNTGRTPHTVTAADGSFDATIRAGETFSHLFDRPGTYEYRCTFHDGMAGQIVVTGSAVAPAATPTPAPTPAPAPANRPAPPPGAFAIGVRDNSFDVAVARIAAGTTVGWTNHGAIRHTVTSASGLFDSGLLPTGASFSVTFSRPGTYAYVCDLHPGMRGVIEVTGPAVGDAPVTAATPPMAFPTAAPSASPPAASAAIVAVAVDDNFFAPKDLDVTVGTTVTWTLRGAVKHTVTFADGPTSEVLSTGQTFSRTFATPGTYAYLCALHPGMTGTVRVAAAAPAGVTTTAGPTADAASRAAPPAVVARGGGSQPDSLAGLALGVFLALLGFAAVGGPVVMLLVGGGRRTA